MPKLALVTGGHRRLGGAIAAALAEAGYAVALHGSHDCLPEFALEQALSASGVEWRGFVADFSDLDAAEELVGEVAAAFGRAPDLLVNSASAFGQDRLENVSPDDLMDHYAINTAAPVLLTKAFATIPAERHGRNIVNLLDQRIAHPHADQLSYTLSKLALAGFTRLTARTLAPAIRVNAVAPGLTLPTGDYAADAMERLAGQMPLGVLPTPEDIAAAVLFLANAPAITGQTIFVDGGASMVAYDRDFMSM